MQRRDRGHDADADDRHVAWHDLAVVEANPAHAHVALQPVDLHAEADLDAMGAVLGLVEARQRRAGDAGKDAVLRLEHGDVLAELGQHRGRFQADIAATDNGHPRGRGEFGGQGIDVGAGTDGVDARRGHARRS